MSRAILQESPEPTIAGRGPDHVGPATGRAMSTTSCPAPRRPATTACAPSSESHRKTQVGPEPETRPRSAPSASPTVDQGAELGSQVDRRRLQVVVEGAGEPQRLAARQRGQQVGRLGGLGERVGEELVEVRGRPRAWTARRRTGRRPTTTCRGRRAAAPARRGHVHAPYLPRGRTGRRCRARAASSRSTSSGRPSVVQPVVAPAASRRRRPSPPAMPPATGIDLRISTARRRAGRCGRGLSSSARKAMLSPPSGTSPTSM